MSEENKDNLLIDDYRNKLWKEGWLIKEGQKVKNWRKRYFVLRGSKLYYFKNDKKLESDLKGTFDIYGCEVRYRGERKQTNDEEGKGGGDSDDSDEEKFQIDLTPNTPVLGPGTPVISIQDSTGVQTSISVQSVTNNNSIGAFKYKFSLEKDERTLYVCSTDMEDVKIWMKNIQNSVNVENYFKACEKHGTKPLFGVVKVLTDDSVKTLIVRDELFIVDSIQALSDVISRNKVLKKITLMNCHLTDNIMKIIACGIAQNEELITLDLTNNRISDLGIIELFTALYINITIQEINLSGNFIQQEGAYHLSELLKANISLTNVDLSNNDIQKEGCQFIAQCLMENTSLVELNLGNNNIGDEGSKYLSEGLKWNKSLKKLSLPKNAIGSQGLTYLCESIGSNNSGSLNDLNLQDNLIDAKGVISLVNVLKENKNISRVDLGNNKNIGTTGIAALAEALKSRYQISNLVMTRSVKK
jgi:Ran GTPase-activating protein (RanGAP) involved in mRNA processing and transport